MPEGSNYDKVWFNGELVPWERATVHVTQIGPASVSSVFEGIRGYWNEDKKELYIFQLDAHLRRFLQSIRLVRLATDYALDDLRDALVSLVRANGPTRDVYIRPFAYAESRTFGSATTGTAKIVMHVTDWDSQLKNGVVSHSAVSSWARLSDNVMAPRVKASANYLNSRYASEEAKRNGYDHAIILNPNGKVAEGPGMCLMLVRGGKVITPSVTSGILESVTRDTVIQLLREKLNAQVIEREVDRTELYVADEAFFCGTGIEVVPILTIDRLPVGDAKPGVLSQRLLDCYHDIVRGIDPSYGEWRTLVGSQQEA